MTRFEIYRGRPGEAKPPPDPFLAPVWSGLSKPAGYVADQGLADAVNVALTLGQPLLLTGEAGSGKTQLAYSLAFELQLGPPLKFETKSTSEAKDLFYTYNALGRFQAAQTGEGSQDARDYLAFNALGEAILRANDPADVSWLFREGVPFSKRSRSVVLIDEIDKAPRDFPNDILNEIDEMYFRIPELNNRIVSADRSLRPIVVLTSNSEKNLPDAFLRRCVFYFIPFPDRQRLREIINQRLAWVQQTEVELLNDAIGLFEFLRSSQCALTKPPATAELLGWLLALKSRFPGEVNPLRGPPARIESTLCTLLKTGEDLKRSTQLLERWSAQRNLESNQVLTAEIV
jgi:MoxR-like ATPase